MRLYAADVESDLSVFHRVDDPSAMDGPRYFRYAVRLPFYEGAMRIVALGLMGENGEASSPDAASLRSVDAAGGIKVNVPGRGPAPVPEGATYVDGDQASLMASATFRDVIEFARG